MGTQLSAPFETPQLHLTVMYERFHGDSQLGVHDVERRKSIGLDVCSFSSTVRARTQELYIPVHTAQNASSLRVSSGRNNT